MFEIDSHNSLPQEPEASERDIDKTNGLGTGGIDENKQG
jgi:hypothetical protein